ncbi:MAG: hypothetical protein KKC80_02835 [Candidatus Margulisbacteria bacterium]|nr:hypothetical protein [Candidatus Margulisiibacteriota bacterium]MBU1616800.1 hypothetical protein [Candidatus Margulisiibacteriota bacterium]MBU1867100.1 hypothetical protein [Candidatus Margulisiibacteriota bacterium]
MIKPVSFQTHPSFVLRRARGIFAYEKTMRALRQKILDGSFRPTYNRDTANFNFREMLLRPYENGKYCVHLPKYFDEWQDLFEDIFRKMNFSREVVVGRENLTGNRFPPNIRQIHSHIIRDQLVILSILENWLYYNKDILNDLVNNF